MFDILMLQSSFFNGKGGTLGLKRVETFEKNHQYPLAQSFIIVQNHFPT
jgi:hypothetical protein